MRSLGILVMGGLNPVYMKRLALYMSGKLGSRYRVVISNDSSFEGGRSDGDDNKNTYLCMGSEEFVDESGLILSESRQEDDRHICMYQSADRILSRVIEIYEKRYGACNDFDDIKAQWILMTGDISEPELLAHSMGYAAMLSEETSVLYINMCGKSGMNTLLELDELASLSDLIIELRSGMSKISGRYICSDGGLNLLSIADNPATISELKEADGRRLIEIIGSMGSFEKVVVVIDAVRESNRSFIEKCSKCIHVSEDGILAEAASHEWQRYLKKRYPDLEVDLVRAEQIGAQHCGRTLISEWRYTHKWKSGTI